MQEEEARLRIEALRRSRVRPAPDTSAGDLFARRGVELAGLERRIGGAARAWQSVCPAELLGRTSVRSVARGVVTIGVEDASTRFELDRLLRAGAERTFIRACAASVRRVRLIAAPPDAETEGTAAHE